MWKPKERSQRFRQTAIGVAICTVFSLLLASVGLFRGTLGHFSRHSSTSSQNWAGWDRAEKLFVFGDSWSTTQFDQKGHQPDEKNPFGNEPDQGRKDGPNWIHFLTETYNQTYLKTYNFAKGGAVIDDKIMQPKFGGAGMSLRKQVHDIFKPDYAARDTPQNRRWDPSRTLFALCFGVNELTIAFQDRQHLPISDVMASYGEALDELYFAGARNFLFLNMPPLDRAYSLQKDTSTLAIQIVDYNKELEVMRQKLIEKTPDANVMVFDTHALYEHILNDPQTLPQTAGITRTRETCPIYFMGVPLTTSGEIELDHYSPKCGAPINEFFWMNSLNPTYPVHNGTAAMIIQDCMTGGQIKRFCS